MQNHLYVTDENGKETSISLNNGAYSNTKDKADGKFEIAKKVLLEIGKIIDKAEEIL